MIDEGVRCNEPFAVSTAALGVKTAVEVAVRTASLATWRLIAQLPRRGLQLGIV